MGIYLGILKKLNISREGLHPPADLRPAHGKSRHLAVWIGREFGLRGELKYGLQLLVLKRIMADDFKGPIFSLPSFFQNFILS